MFLFEKKRHFLQDIGNRYESQFQVTGNITFKSGIQHNENKTKSFLLLCSNNISRY